MSARRGNVRVYIEGDASGLDRATRQAQGSLGKLGTAAKRAGQGLATAFAVATAYTTKQTIDFDASMRNVNSIAQLNESQFQKLQGAVLDLAGPTAQAPKTLAEGLYDLVSSGFDSAESLGILEKSAKAATAGLTTTEVSTAAVAAVLNAYHLPAKAAGKVSDQLFRTVDRGVLSFEDLASSVGDVLPFASSLGVGLDQVGAATATMTKAGINAPETMTRIKNVMVTLLKPGSDLKNAIQDLGFESGESLVRQKGLQGGLEALVGSTDGTKEAVAALFPNIRAMGGALALTGKNAKGARDDLEGMKEAAGATDRALSQQSKSISHAWNQIKAEVSAAAIRLGSQAVPAVMDFVRGVRAGTGAGGDFRRTVESIGAVLGPVAVGAGNVALTVGQLGIGFVQTKAAMILLGAAAGALVGRMTALGVAWGISKITTVVTAIQGFASVMGVLRTVYVAQTGVTNASTLAILKHAAATRLAAAGYSSLRAAIASTGIGLLIVLAGTAVGALLGMSAATDDAATASERLRDALRGQADAMREVRDIDIDVAQRKNALAAANNAVERAERRVNSLLKAGKKDTLAYREATVDLKNAQLEQKRASRDLNRAQEDSNRKRRDGIRAAVEAGGVAREELRDLHDRAVALKKARDAGVVYERSGEALARVRLGLAQAQRAEVQSTLALKRIQLEQAKASDESSGKVKRLKDEIEKLEGKSRDGGRRVKVLRDEIELLKSKRVKVDVDLNLLMPGGGVFSGAGDRQGSGWPLAKAVQSGAQAMADKDPMSFLAAAAGGGLGAGRAAGVDAFTPFAARYGLQMTSGYRPGDDGYHGVDRARDYAGSAPAMLAFSKFMAAAFGSRLLELIHTPLGFSIKNGRRVAPYAQADHYDHTHVALATGGPVTKPTVIVGEEAPRHHEWVIATNPAYRRDNVGYWMQAGRDLGVPGFEKGGPTATASGSRGFKGNLPKRFQRAAAEIWEDAAPYYGKSKHSRMPMTLVGGTDGHAGVTTRSRTAILSRSAAMGVLGYRPRGKVTLLHEWTHVHQRRRGTELWEREGGATAFAAWAGPRIFGRYEDGSPRGDFSAGTDRYARFAKRVIKSRGWPWVKRGQFGFAKGGKVDWPKLVGSSWDNDELATLAHIVGMRNPGLMAQYAQGESGGDARATNRNTDGTIDKGLWMVNSVHGFSGDLLDPWVNAKAAASVLASQGIGAWYADPTGPRGEVDASLAKRFRAAIAGKGTDPDQIPVHGRTKLSYDEKTARLDTRLAKAETTASLKDDRRAAVAKLDLLRTRKRFVEKQVRQINEQLKGKLKPPERDRLLGKRESFLSELSSMPGDASSLVEALREAGVGQKKLKKYARGFGIGIWGQDKPTAADRADLQLARAEATPGKEDDLAALQRLRDIAEQQLATAKKSGDPRQIAEATRNLTAAAEALREATPTAADYANRDLALAELTEGLGDDRAALEQLKRIAQADLDAALQTADPRDDIEAAQRLKSATDALKSLDETIAIQNELLRQQQEFQKERLALDKRLADLAETQGPAMLASLLAWVDGAMGGPVQRRSTLPTTPGVNAGYA